MKQRRRLGLPSPLWCEPLAKALQGQEAFELLRDSTMHHALRLREQSIHAAFLSPIDYARESSFYRIVPGVAVSSRGGNNSAVLHFRQGVRTFDTLAVDPTSVSEIILARVILAEEFDVEAKIVPVEGPLEEKLRRADAALLMGDEALREMTRQGNMLDLVEVWSELTELPYVHGFWCTWEGELTIEEARLLGTHGTPDDQLLDTIASEAAVQHNLPDLATTTVREYLGSFSYEFDAQVEEGIREFLTFAFYHGVLPDVPELNYLSSESPDETADGPSL